MKFFTLTSRFLSEIPRIVVWKLIHMSVILTISVLDELTNRRKILLYNIWNFSTGQNISCSYLIIVLELKTANVSWYK